MLSDKEIYKNQNPCNKLKYLEIYIACCKLNVSCQQPNPTILVELEMLQSNERQDKVWVKQSEIKDILNSNIHSFTNPLECVYLFEQVQEIRFLVFEIVKGQQNIFLGAYNTQLKNLIKFNRDKEKNILKDDQGREIGYLSINTVDANLNQSMIELDMNFQLEKNSSSDDYRIKIYRQLKKPTGIQSILVFQQNQKRLKNSLVFHINEKRGKFFREDKMKEIKVELLQVNEGEEILGQVILNYTSHFTQGSQPVIMDNVGTIQIKNFHEEENYTFIEYLHNGLQINLIVGIDFTSSNGFDRNYSLHQKTHAHDNQYAKAISTVGKILLDYDDDKKVPMYGFGGIPKFPHYMKQEVGHSFPLTGYEMYPEVIKLEGMLSSYFNAIDNVHLHIPTLLAPLLQLVMNQANQSKILNKNNFYVLLVLTDGYFKDKEQVIDLITKSTRLPLSIIIVGIGSFNFKSMEELDNLQIERDLVSFVPLNKYKGNMREFSDEVLKELPTSVEVYHKLIQKKPNQYSQEKEFQQEEPSEEFKLSQEYQKKFLQSQSQFSQIHLNQ